MPNEVRTSSLETEDRAPLRRQRNAGARRRLAPELTKAYRLTALREHRSYAIVTSTAGTTRDWRAAPANIAGLSFQVVDTGGLDVPDRN